MATPAVNSGINYVLEREHRQRLEEATQHVVNTKSLSIFTYGITGAGKSTLVRDILGRKKDVPKPCSGVKPAEAEGEVYIAQLTSAMA